MGNGGLRYCINCLPGEMPNWLSYSGEGCSLSFHIPQVFQGLVVWFVCSLEIPPWQLNSRTTIIIRNKSNGIQLFEDKRLGPEPAGWIRYISRSEMAMKDYCGDHELELHIYSEPIHYCGDDELKLVHIKECGVHVIAGKSDSFEESKVRRDIVMPASPLPYHLLPHPLCGSITASTPKQWSDYLFAKLQEHSLDLILDGKNKYFI